MAYIRFDELEHIRRKHTDEKIVFCSGCFDVTHAGHVLFFEDCKKLGDILVVMVGADAVVKRDKSNERPIINEHLRLKMVDSLKPVDYTFLDFIFPEAPHPLHVVDMVMGKLKPDSYVINNDARDIPYRENLSKKHDVPLIILDRTAPPEFEGISTTKIIEKIKSL
ncbi:MAG: adenylyltransferase/cytidyltransferase family protein [Patescibacteria group bacterium]